jgi:RNA polymerase sigma factor (sigma-70 family)
MVSGHDILAVRAARGDRDALVCLLEQNAPEMRRRLARRIPRRWQHALTVDDVVQQTYVDAFLDVGNFSPNGEGSFAAWLGTLARHNLLDAVRMLEADKRGGGHPGVRFPSSAESFVALAEVLQAESGTPSRSVARDEACEALKSAVCRLPEPYRQVVQMYDLEVRSVGEVAEALSKSLGAVFMIRARAHRRLRSMLGEGSAYLTGG